MRRFLDELKDFRKKGDLILLVLCWIVAGFGLVVIACWSEPCGLL